MSTMEEYDISEWVESAANNVDQEFREAVHTILAAIASEPQLKASMIIKGGILLAIRYHSHRFTKDIDFSAQESLSEISPDQIEEKLNNSLEMITESLGYDLDCRIQSCKVMPANIPEPSNPSIKLTVGYAYKGTSKHRRLQSLQSTTTIAIDFSLNEKMQSIEKLVLGQGEDIFAYSITDLIAEKYRSLLQQVVRNRTRRQDVFDIYLILEMPDTFDRVERNKIYLSLLEKSKARNISPAIDSLEDTEIRQRAEADYYTLADEVEGELPDFDLAYEKILEFYKSLPW